MPSEDAKAAKKEDASVGESAAKTLSSVIKTKPTNRNNAASTASKSRPKNTKVKKEEPQADDDDFQSPIKGSSAVSRSKETKVKKQETEDDDKPISKRSSAKPDKEKEVKRKKQATGEKDGKRERKVFDLPGQKKDPPEGRDALRIFYETLYKQVPTSEMAQFWMMECGLLPFEEAKKVFEKKQSKSQLGKLTSPMKTTSAAKSSTKTATVKKTLPSSSVSSSKNKTSGSKVGPKHSKKSKAKEESSDTDSDEEFLVKRVKKVRAK